MIITFKRFGRLGNRLFLFSHLIAFAEWSNVSVFMPAFSEFIGSFPFFKNPLCEYIPKGKDTNVSNSPSALGLRAAGLIRAIPTVRFWDERDIVFDGEDATDSRVRTMIESPRVVFEGWRFRSHETILGIMPRIRTVFAPKENILHHAEALLEHARGMGDIVIGVHLRWEDYRGTPYFFPLNVFLNRMKEIASFFKPMKVSFVICSPEKLKQEDFPDTCVFSSDGSPVQDMYSLAGCDYILGPPSTFSGWASFYGSKPLFTMRKDIPFDNVSEADIVRW